LVRFTAGSSGRLNQPTDLSQLGKGGLTYLQLHGVTPGSIS